MKDLVNASLVGPPHEMSRSDTLQTAHNSKNNPGNRLGIALNSLSETLQTTQNSKDIVGDR